MKILSPVLCLSILFFIATSSFGQGAVGIGTAAPDDSAILEIESSNKGVLVPRMNLRPTNPAEGLIIYNTSIGDGVFEYYDGASWVQLIATPASIDLNMQNNKIINLADGTDDGDAVNKGQLDDIDDSNVNINGSDVMTGNLDMDTHRIRRLEDGVSSTDAANIGQLYDVSDDLSDEIDDLSDEIGLLKVGVANIGDVHGDESFTVSFTSIGTDQYIVMGSVEGNSSNVNNDNDTSYVVYDKTASSFKLYFREYSSNTQNLYFRFMLFRSTTR